MMERPTIRAAKRTKSYQMPAFFFSLVFFISAFSANLAMAQMGTEQGMFVMCRLGKIVRTIRVVLRSPNRCETLYTKGGRDRSVGQSSNVASCESFLNNVRSNLEKASWKCKEIEGVKVSSQPTVLPAFVKKNPAG